MITIELISTLEKASKALDEEAFCEIFGDEKGSPLFDIYCDLGQNIVQFINGLQLELKLKLISHLNIKYNVWIETFAKRPEENQDVYITQTIGDYTFVQTYTYQKRFRAWFMANVKHWKPIPQFDIGLPSNVKP